MLKNKCEVYKSYHDWTEQRENVLVFFEEAFFSIFPSSLHRKFLSCYTESFYRGREREREKIC